MEKNLSFYLITLAILLPLWAFLTLKAINKLEEKKELKNRGKTALIIFSGMLLMFLQKMLTWPFS